MNAGRARALLAAGRPADAIGALVEELARKSDPDAARLLGRLLGRYQLGASAPVKAALRNVAKAPRFDLQPFVRAIVDVVKTGPAWFEVADADEGMIAARIAAGNLAPFDDALLLAALTRCVLHDVELERVMLLLRAALLGAKEPPVPLMAAVARQSANNEYAWPFDPEEENALEVIKQRSPLISEPDLLRFCMYRAPADLAPPMLLASARWAAQETRALLQNTLTHPEEAALRDTLPRLKVGENGGAGKETSNNVRAQYEENPYPRWLALNPPDEGERRARLQARGLTGDAKGPLAVLIAGCGTGRQAISAFAGYGKPLSLTALDLSAASLAYATRKAKDYGVEIEFIQGDILDLDALDRNFDVIESIGVLHHMEDPLAGWRALARRLRPGGVMNVALYSERGRQDIVAARARVEELGLPADADGVRRLRRLVLDAPDDANDWRVSVRRFTDFYSTSGCRDLLLHAHERRFTPAEIGDALQKLGLEFRGLETSAATLAAYRKRFPADQNGRSLANWDALEQEQPTLFAGMINLWCGKPA